MKIYTERFHLLLYLEEIQMEVDIKKYDLYGKTMTLDKTNKRLLVLNVSVRCVFTSDVATDIMLSVAILGILGNFFIFMIISSLSLSLT